MLYSSASNSASRPDNIISILTAKLGAVLVRIFGSLFVSGTRNIEQTIHARLYRICTLVAKLEWLLCISCVLVDYLIDKILDRRNIFRCTELKVSVTRWRGSYDSFTSRMLISILDLAPVRAS